MRILQQGVVIPKSMIYPDLELEESEEDEEPLFFNGPAVEDDYNHINMQTDNFEAISTNDTI